MATNVVWSPSLKHPQRTALAGQRGFTIWMTGLSASGKSTIATALEQELLHRGISAYRLDGDNMRFGLCKDLGFSPSDRKENIRRVAEVARLFADSCTVCIASFISPMKADRQFAREVHHGDGGAKESDNLAKAVAKAATAPTSEPPTDPAPGAGELPINEFLAPAPPPAFPPLPFIECYIEVSLAIAESRDPKGFYKAARAGKIADFTGVNAPYEAPDNPEIRIRSGEDTVEQSVAKIVQYLVEHDLINMEAADKRKAKQKAGWFS